MSNDSPRGPRPAHECFVCGPDNPIGLHLVFRLEDGTGGQSRGVPAVVKPAARPGAVRRRAAAAASRTTPSTAMRRRRG